MIFKINFELRSISWWLNKIFNISIFSFSTAKISAVLWNSIRNYFIRKLLIVNFIQKIDVKLYLKSRIEIQLKWEILKLDSKYFE